MEVYQTEEEQVEALKRWWDENGKGLIIWIVVVLASVFGFRSWQDMQITEAETTAIGYQQVMDSGNADVQRTTEAALAVIQNNPSSQYAIFSALMLAKIGLENGDPAQAETQLRWAISNSDDDGLRAIAQLRLARVLLSTERSDEAQTTLNGVDEPQFAAIKSEISGDILLEKGERQQAYEAYQQALAGFSDNPDKQRLLQMKIDNLTPVNA